jgi:methylenetetrahydrofolate reductase (NADPH)
MPLPQPIRIDELLGKGLPSISFEFFPPRTEEGFASLYRAIDELRPLEPTFVSVTYGAGGSTRQKTVELVSRIQNEIGLRAMAHLTCVGHTADELAAVLDQLHGNGIANVLALRGDPPQGQTALTAVPGGFSYANELVALAAGRHNFCVGVAGHPEGHPQCLNRTRDLENLKRKLDFGGRFVVTQLFLDNNEFYRFRDSARLMGITAPIVAGIMPIGNVSQVKRFVSMCGAKIPHRLLLQLEKHETDAAAVQQIGLDYAIRQCQDLLQFDVDGLHFYTLNRSKATVQIVQSLRARHG